MKKFRSVVLTLIAIGIGVSLAMMQATSSKEGIVQSAPVDKARMQIKAALPEQPQSTSRTAIRPSGPIEKPTRMAFTPAVPTKTVVPSVNRSEVRGINLGPDIDPEEVPLEMHTVPPVNIGEDLDPEKIYTGREELTPRNIGPDLDPEWS